MDLGSVLRAVQERGIRLYRQDGALRFEAPSGALSDDLRAQLRVHKESLLQMLAAQEGGAQLQIGTGLEGPLSLQQERLWLVSRLQGEAGTLHIPLMLSLEVEPDTERLQAALRALQMRHQVLQTRLCSQQGQWRQQIAPELEIHLKVEQLAADSDSWREVVQARVGQLKRECFDLEQEPPLRAWCLRLHGAKRSVLVLIAHHVGVDALALHMMLQDLLRAYLGQKLGSGGLRYLDYARWQRQEPQMRQLQEMAEEYAGLLQSCPVLHDLPLDHERPARQSYQGAQVRQFLPAAAVARLQQLCAAEDCSLFMGMQALLAALLARYSAARRSEIMLGAPVANRNLAQFPELEEVAGCFVNMMVLRIKVDSAHSFAELLQQVRQFNRQVYPLQAVPLDMLLERLGIAGQAAHHPLYQVTIGMQPPAPHIGSGALAYEMLVPEKTSSQQDLGLDLTQEEQGILARWEYNTDIFKAASIERLASHFAVLLDQVCAQPQTALGQLSYLLDDEKLPPPRQLSAQAGLMQAGSLGAAFTAVAKAHPQQTALILDEEKISYASLLQNAQELAAGLQSLGVGVGSVVGISTENCRATWECLLALCLCQAAYVPLDAAYPAQRLESIADQAGLSLILAGDALLDAFPAWGSLVNILHYDQLPRSQAALQGLSAASAALDLPAYMVFSSGSTGAPKGIIANQRGVLRLVASAPWMQLAPGQVCLQAATLAFDASTFEIWNTWLQGGTLAVVSPQVLLQPALLAEFIRRRRVEVAFFTTAYFNRLVEQGVEALAQLRRVLFGGEAVSLAAVRQALRTCPDTALVHVYGPTENTTFSTGYALSSNWGQEQPGQVAAHTVPIGAALETDCAYVLDENMELVHVGGIGELYLGGPGLALGYQGQSALTAQQFVPDPFATRPGQRLYRSGDLVRRLAGEVFEFVRRRDRQVKINGYRIEPAEIEETLRKSARIAECIVVVREEQQQRQMWAYVRPQPGYQLDAAQVRQTELAAIPAYMQPARLIVVEQFVLNRNGKIDPAALPQQAEGAAATPAPTVRVMSAGEQKVALLWQECLGQEVHDAQANFFELGGNSLQAMSICHLLQERLGVKEVPLAQFFHTPSIAYLASLLPAHSEETPALAPVVGVVAEDLQAGQRAPISPLQQSIYFEYLRDTHSTAYNMGVWFALRGQLQTGLLEQALRNLLQAHPALRTCFPDDGELEQEVLPCPVHIMQQRQLAPGDNLQEAIVQILNQPFELGEELPLRVCLLQQGPQDYTLVLCVHHIAADASALHMLFTQLCQQYTALVLQQPAFPVPPGLAYLEYARQHSAWVQGQECRQLLQQCAQQLQDLPPPFAFGQVAPGAALASQGMNFDGAQFAGLDRCARQLQCSRFELLLAAFALALGRQTGREQVLLGVTVSTRNQAQLAGTVGYFVNLVPLLVQVPAVVDRAWLAQLQARLRQLQQAAQLPYPLLRQYLQAQTPALRNHPLVQVNFTYVPLGFESGVWPKLEVGSAHSHTTQSKFALNIQLQDAHGQLQGSVQRDPALVEEAWAAALTEGWRAQVAALILQLSDKN